LTAELAKVGSAELVKLGFSDLFLGISLPRPVVCLLKHFDLAVAHELIADYIRLLSGLLSLGLEPFIGGKEFVIGDRTLTNLPRFGPPVGGPIAGGKEVGAGDRASDAGVELDAAAADVVWATSVRTVVRLFL